ADTIDAQHPLRHRADRPADLRRRHGRHHGRCADGSLLAGPPRRRGRSGHRAEKPVAGCDQSALFFACCSSSHSRLTVSSSRTLADENLVKVRRAASTAQTSRTNPPANMTILFMSEVMTGFRTFKSKLTA